MASDQTRVLGKTYQTPERRGRSRLGRTVAGGVLTVVLLLVVVSPAIASNFGSRYADNGSHYYFYSGLESYTVTAANWGRNRVNNTDMNTYWDGACYSGTDVCVYDANYSGSWWSTHYGKATCVKTMSGGKCDKFQLQFDTGNLSGYSTTKLRRAGCHEWGHTTGLKHFDSVGGSSSCMWSNINNANQSSYYSYHDIMHVNGRY